MTLLELGSAGRGSGPLRVGVWGGEEPAEDFMLSS